MTKGLRVYGGGRIYAGGRIYGGGRLYDPGCINGRGRRSIRRESIVSIFGACLFVSKKKIDTVSIRVYSCLFFVCLFVSIRVYCSMTMIADVFEVVGW